LDYYNEPTRGGDGVVVIRRYSDIEDNLFGNMLAIANNGRIYLYEEKEKIAAIIDLNRGNTFLTARDTNNQQTISLHRQTGRFTLQNPTTSSISMDLNASNTASPWQFNGNLSVFNGNLGIGTTTPEYPSHIVSDTTSSKIM
jgi:hypothetical protein